MCLSLRNGELFAFLGQNGAGKSYSTAKPKEFDFNAMTQVQKK
jgi:hypothetical protein